MGNGGGGGVMGTGRVWVQVPAWAKGPPDGYGVRPLKRPSS